MPIPDFYKTELDPAELEQGDILQPNTELLDLLVKYHPYYASHPKNKFYAVLTQSCDLVNRSGEYGARYISIAPVRPLSAIIAYEFKKKLTPDDSGEPYGTDTVRGDVERFLERLLNNNEPSYFHYFDEATAGLIEPMCAMLALPISLKTEHYGLLLSSRRTGIQNIFQAKLGWLLGQTYSRVGTPELRSDELRSSINNITNTLALWFSSEDFKHLKKLIADHRAANPSVPLDRTVLADLIKRIPKKKALVVERILDIAAEISLCAKPSKARFKFRNALEQDPQFAQFF